jgi:uncharacterized membrane protein
MIEFEGEEQSLLDDKKNSSHQVEIRKVYSNYKHDRKKLSKLKLIVILLICLIFSPLILSFLLIITAILLLLTFTCILPAFILFYDTIRTCYEKNKRILPHNLFYYDVGGYKIACAFNDTVFTNTEEDLKKPIVVFMPGVGVSPTSIFGLLDQYYTNYRLVAFDKGN